ncbi:MAG: hypothetical protein NUV68_02640 [Caldiserica bacterium]|jgi:beta-RFAP synthase|nr:hypothetical protein [Caldisericota bacterium]MDH7562556.1 hypothetical protein [Caldisericota bacterium]
MRLRISAPARLHFGFIDLNGELGRLFGSLGMAIDFPKVVLEGETLEKNALPLEGCEKIQSGETELWVKGESKERVADFARRFLSRYPLRGRFLLNCLQAIPPHVGLGSGTQLALSVGTMLSHLGGRKIDPSELAPLMGRGVHSGIGIGTFQFGGFIVDGGHRTGKSALKSPPIIFHHEVPSSWNLVLGIPSVEHPFKGEGEERAFKNLPPAPSNLAERISRLLLMKMLPALIEEDIYQFSQALTLIQQLVGDSFAPVQGGRFANYLSSELIAFWLEKGVAGAGQSSWGPSVYAFLEKEEEAMKLVEISRDFLQSRGGGTVFLAKPYNLGASIETL